MNLRRLPVVGFVIGFQLLVLTACGGTSTTPTALPTPHPAAPATSSAAATTDPIPTTIAPPAVIQPDKPSFTADKPILDDECPDTNKVAIRSLQVGANSVTIKGKACIRGGLKMIVLAKTSDDRYFVVSEETVNHSTGPVRFTITSTSMLVPFDDSGLTLVFAAGIPRHVDGTPDHEGLINTLKPRGWTAAEIGARVATFRKINLADVS